MLPRASNLESPIRWARQPRRAMLHDAWHSMVSRPDRHRFQPIELWEQVRRWPVAPRKIYHWREMFAWCHWHTHQFHTPHQWGRDHHHSWHHYCRRSVEWWRCHHCQQYWGRPIVIGGIGSTLQWLIAYATRPFQRHIHASLQHGLSLQDQPSIASKQSPRQIWWRASHREFLLDSWSSSSNHPLHSRFRRLLYLGHAHDTHSQHHPTILRDYPWDPLCFLFHRQAIQPVHLQHPGGAHSKFPFWCHVAEHIADISIHHRDGIQPLRPCRAILWGSGDMSWSDAYGERRHCEYRPDCWWWWRQNPLSCRHRILADALASLIAQFLLDARPAQRSPSHTSSSPTRQPFMRYSGHSRFHFGIDVEPPET